MSCQMSLVAHTPVSQPCLFLERDIKKFLRWNVASWLYGVVGRLRGFGLSLAAYSEPTHLESEVLICVDERRPSRAGGQGSWPPYSSCAHFLYTRFWLRLKGKNGYG